MPQSQRELTVSRSPAQELPKALPQGVTTSHQIGAGLVYQGAPASGASQACNVETHGQRLLISEAQRVELE